MSSTSPETQPAQRLAWSLRHHKVAIGLVALLIVLATALAVARLLITPPEQTATATVLASDLAHDPASLARLAETVAAEPAVLDDAIVSGDLPYDRESLREEHSEVRPLEDNVLVLVDGIDSDPELAIDTANALAEALTAELNRAGPGVGEFRILTRATVAEPHSVVRDVALYVVAGLVALVAGVLATAALFNAWKRPVTSPASAAGTLGQPVLAVIDGNKWTADAPYGPYHALADGLRGKGVTRVLWLAPPRDARLTQLIAQGLSKHFDGTAPTGRHAHPAVDSGPAAQNGVSSMFVPDGARAVVVAPEGVPADVLVRAAQRVSPDSVAGLVFVASPRPMRRVARRLPKQEAK